MLRTRRLCALGGSGWMGRATLIPALEQGVLAPEDLIVVNRSGDLGPFKAFPQVQVTTDLASSLRASDAVLLSVRPGDFPPLNIDLKNKLTLSYMAGVTPEAVAKHTGAQRIIWAMPNAAAEQAQSFTPLLMTEAVTEEERRWAAELLRASGQTAELSSNAHMAAMTALTGSSQGWLAFIALSAQRAAEAQGIPPALAEQAVRGVMAGMGAFIGTHPSNFQTMVDTKKTYGGTTAAFIKGMETSGVAEGMAAALKASTERAASDMTRDGPTRG